MPVDVVDFNGRYVCHVIFKGAEGNSVPTLPPGPWQMLWRTGTT